MSFRPTGKRVLVEPKPADEKNGMILIPPAHREQAKEGIVRAVGAGNEDVKVGDRVLVEREWNTLFNIGGRNHWLINQQDIVAILE